MNRRNKFIALVGILLAALFFPELLLASEEGGHGGGSQLVDLAWRFVNFGIFAAVLYFAAAKPARNFLDGRIAGIKKQLDDAENGKLEAEKKAAECIAKLENLEEEVAEIEKTLIHEGEVERDRIIEAAEVAAEKIRAQAKFSAEQEMKKAIIAIKEEAAEAAMSMAEKVLKAEVKKDDQKKLVTQYLNDIQGSVN